jgi:hypothetical protein
MSEGPEDPIEVLRAEVDALREALQDEVRTRRVVVVDAVGRPRVVLAAGPGLGSVRVDAEGGDPSVELYAVDGIEADGPEVGLALVVAGDVVRTFRRRVVSDGE